nr:FGGY-family carbohydrate kinase [Spirochaeta sp.]
TVDTTGSSPTAIGSDGRPLAYDDAFSADPAAMMILWKDHAAEAEAREISEGLGVEYSSEWFWAKVLHAARESEPVRAAAVTWAEHADWFPALLCDNRDPGTWKRCRSGAAHKSLWRPDPVGYPARDLFQRVDPYLATVWDTLGRDAWSPDERFGVLATGPAERLGVPAGIAVGVGVFDAHSAALAGGVRPGTVAKIIGTSSSDMVVTDLPIEHGFPGVESAAFGSIVPGRVTIESGQAAYGDLTEWLVRLISFGSDVAPRLRDDLFHALESAAAGAAATMDLSALPVALDWFNGRRSPFGNTNVRGAVTGLSLGTSAPELYLSLLEAAACATRAGLEHLHSLGVGVEQVHVLGGVPDRSELAVTVLANVLGRPLSVRESADASARGAAIYAAVVGGVYPDVLTSQSALQLAERHVVTPKKHRTAEHEPRYRRYRELAASVSTPHPY